MNHIKKIFEPLTSVGRQYEALLVITQAVVGLGLWQIFGGGGLIPTPSKILFSTLKVVQSNGFLDNVFSSLVLTTKGMAISMLLALIVCYASLIPFFNPVARFIIKCRYLTLTGLIFLFTLLTRDGSQLKLGLLIFGIVPFFVTSFLSVIESINIQEFELCKTLRMNNWRSLYEVVIIGRLDQVLEVMRQNFAIAWMMITMVEGLSMSEGGLGTLLIKSNKYIDLGTVLGILLIILAMGIFFDFLLSKLRHWLFPYTKLQVRK